MNNQEQPEQIQKKSDVVDNRRHFIKGAGIAAPVVLSLTSRSVFGAQCLSQVMSGNMSNVGEGSCALGKKPIEWQDPSIGTGITELRQTSNVRTPASGVTTLVDKQVIVNYLNNPNQRVKIVIETFKREQTFKWRGTNFDYGLLTTTRIVTKINKITATGATGTAVTSEVTVIDPNPAPIPGTTPANTDLNGIVIGQAKFTRGTKWEYTGGIPLISVITLAINDQNTLPTAVCSDFTGGTIFGTLPMRQILCADADSDDSASVAALLNASYTPKINYVLTIGQVNDLISGNPDTPVPDGYASAAAFFKSTW